MPDRTNQPASNKGVSPEALDKAFEALKSYDWGSDITAVEPIDDAITAAHGNAAARKQIEARLIPILKSDAPRAAKDFVCRKLAMVGSGQSAPALAQLLADQNLSHMACYALEPTPGSEADKALRDGLARSEVKNKAGVARCVGVRREAPATARLAALLNNPDPAVAGAAALALGNIGSSEAAKALQGFRAKAPKDCRNVAAHASFKCAERLLASGKRDEAIAIYRALAAQGQPEHVRMAARRAISAATHA